MKKVGIITEYNPFHNGHKYQIDRIKEELDPDLIVTVMSQDVLQRGQFASFDKFFRTKKALENGVDLVVGLPYAVSSQSAEYFAKGSVKLLEEIGVDTLVFGVEDDDLSELKKIAHLLNNETDAFKQKLKENLKSGQSFPKARANALRDLLDDPEILDKPNNILAIEYLKALEGTKIEPYSIKRVGNNYHDLDITTSFPSASSIRKTLSENITIPDNSVPYSITELVENYKNTAEDMIYSALAVTVINKTATDLAKTAAVNEETANRIIKAFYKSSNLDDFVENIKSKNLTRTAINRILMNILMDFTKEELERFYNDSFIPYLRVLGFNQKARPLLKKLKEKTITNLKKDQKKLNEDQLHFLNLDIKANNLRSLFIRENGYNKEYLNNTYIFDNHD